MCWLYVMASERQGRKDSPGPVSRIYSWFCVTGSRKTFKNLSGNEGYGDRDLTLSSRSVSVLYKD
jgi:hypothetical protein